MNNTIDYTSIPENTPYPIKAAFKLVQKVDQDSYGLVFAVKDLYETVLKVLCLAVCYLLETQGDDSFCRVLLSPKQMAFGDWVNELPSMLKKTDYVLNRPGMRKYIVKLAAFYNNIGIVKWRNDFIGHGLMSAPDDADFFDDVKQKINALIQFLKQRSIPQEIVSLDFDNMAPFMFRDGAEFYLFESSLSSGTTLYTTQTARRRTARDISYFREKSKKYFDRINITQSHVIMDRDIYLSEDDKSVDGYYLLPFYKKPEYMEAWLQKCLDGYRSGIFLMQGGRGTGKSSFVLACDELNQHGKQKIEVMSDGERVSVRAYYCNRIDISHINDFASYINDIFRELPDGNDIRSRSGSLPTAESPLFERLLFYRDQYEEFLGREKLLLFIDGIDELTSRGWQILSMLSGTTPVPKGVYIVLTCRSEQSDIPPVIQDYICNFPFTDTVLFDIRQENHELLKAILKDRNGLTEEQAEKLAILFDDRLSAVPLILHWEIQELLQMTGTSSSVVPLEVLAQKYLDTIKQRYGVRFYIDFVRFLAILSGTVEGLTLGEISALATRKATSLREVCLLKDAAPFLLELRSYRGNLYSVSRPEYTQLLRRLYNEECRELAAEWEAWLSGLDMSGQYRVSENEWDGLLYICANLAEMKDVSVKGAETEAPDIRAELLINIYHLCHSVDVADRIHRTRRALRGMMAVELTLEELIEHGQAEDRLIDLFLECGMEAVKRAVSLRELQYSAELSERVSKLIYDNTSLFYESGSQRRLGVSRLFSHCMIRYCEEYDVEKAEQYYEKAVDAAGEESLYEDGLLEEYYKVRNALVHNYLGVFRNYDQQKTLAVMKDFFETVRKKAPSFSKVSDYLMVALCYKSAYMFEDSEAILYDACDMMEEILEKRGCTYTDITVPYEQEIYINVYLRICQAVNEKVKTDGNAVSFADLKIAMGILDMFIECMIQASQMGYAFFDMLRLDLMTSAALLRNSIAAKLMNTELGGMQQGTSTVKGVLEYKEEAYRAVGIITAGYRGLKDAGVVYNKINAMFNLMNCACIYAGFGDYKESIEIFDKLLAEYEPVNQQEEAVYRMIREKAIEIRKVNRIFLSNITTSENDSTIG